MVRNAFSEVNDAIDAIRQREAQLQELQKQEAYVTEALRIARNRYQNGYASYLDELDAQRTLFSTQLNRVTVKITCCWRRSISTARWAVAGHPPPHSNPQTDPAAARVSAAGIGLCAVAATAYIPALIPK